MEGNEIKMTFGIQQKHIERIEEVSAQYDSYRSEESKQTLEDGWILYERSFWERRGEEFGWEALALALAYFKYKINK
ncbi:MULTISPECIES: hypothetical protein [Weeksellaceae]|uniref:hypothetical protein n=1 Tax=Weeksellaceae TaxID=2762318 RepID=UPI001626085A|nr:MULTISPECIES: hypothetical protein [Weeksellaceae]MDE5432993.1 hypothetical protein [Elizabethkingia meningoseptica]HAY3553800.1 hypothetical protein [Elizabethkingia meningoseptica]